MEVNLLFFRVLDQIMDRGVFNFEEKIRYFFIKMFLNKTSVQYISSTHFTGFSLIIGKFFCNQNLVKIRIFNSVEIFFH